MSIFLPLLLPNFMPSFRKSLERFPRSIRYELTLQCDLIEPVAFAGSTIVPWNNEPAHIKIFSGLHYFFLISNYDLGNKCPVLEYNKK